ncbi:MAG TPA: molybdate ABC transporter substrate-binding protein [Acidimicrobiales bacterium]|jgi:molybdate transport system substrate-binding protein|nr:molybdate ABC transporter substrate-binding protein [Acidimicrobiales bacterium]
MRRTRATAVSLLAMLAVVVAVVAGCGNSNGSTGATAGNSTTSASAVTAHGNVTVFAAASLTEAFGDEKATLATSDPGLSITYSFAGSGELVTQIANGAPADVIATANTSTMHTLVQEGLVEPPVTFARNKLEILVAPGNPKHVKALADLTKSDLTLVLCDETVPAGKYATQIFRAASLTPHPKSLEPDVKAAVTKVVTGEADATVVYVTDVKAAGSEGQGVAIPAAQNAIATYPIAIVKATKHRAAAAAFVDAIVHGSGQRALTARGFLPAS